ncbi:MAG: MFS transporter, partial [Acidimicrobiales bacterium]
TDGIDLNPLHQLNLISKIRNLQGRGPLLRLFGVQVLMTLAFSAYTTIVVLWYVDRLGVSETTAGLLLVAVGFFLIFNELVTVRLAEKRLGDFRTLLLGLLVMPAGFIAVRFPTTIAWFLPASFLLNVGMALTLPSLQTLITNGADERQEGEVQGINTSLAAVSATGAPVFAGAIYASGGGELALPVIAAVAAAAAVLLIASAPVITGVAPRACRQDHLEHGPVHSLAMHCGGGQRSFGLRLWGGQQVDDSQS